MSDLQDILASSPAPRQEVGARERIRQERSRGRRRVVAIDDDPTGSQSVHDVGIVTVLDPAEYAAAIDADLATCFILTNSRSLPESAAVAANDSVGRALFELEARRGTPVDLISRSDSTLRGHVYAEVTALDAARTAVLGKGYDAVLLAPAMFEAGRFTAGDTHWAVVAGVPVPVGRSEFAKDATFGYSSSDLRDFVAEKSQGRIAPQDVMSVSLTDIREGGPDQVAHILRQAAQRPGLTWVVVNGTEYSDYECVVLGLHQVQRDGVAVLARSGPSFCRALAGIEPKGPVTAAELWPQGRGLADAAHSSHGLIVVGSHVGQTARQLEAARARGNTFDIEIDVVKLVDPNTRQTHIEATVTAVQEALATSDVILYTSRTLLRGSDAEESLAIARSVSDALVEVVQAVALRPQGSTRPAWVIAKGGITSHDVAARGLQIRRGTVIGQLFPGMVSVLRAESAPEQVRDMVYVVFPGNVGNDDALADAVSMFRGERDTAASQGSGS